MKGLFFEKDIAISSCIVKRHDSSNLFNFPFLNKFDFYSLLSKLMNEIISASCSQVNEEGKHGQQENRALLLTIKWYFIGFVALYPHQGQTNCICLV